MKTQQTLPSADVRLVLMKRSRQFGSIAIAVMLLIVSCTSPSDGSTDKLVDIGSHKLYLNCRGSGSITIVIETGVGETYRTLGSLIESLSQETRVCAYDRAGYGQSEPGPMPRDSQREADELHQLLTNSGEQGPFLLLGHSLGALNMQVYAHTYPEEINGLVLLDPSPLSWMLGESFLDLRESFIEAAIATRQDAEAAAASSDPGVNGNADYLDAVASESEEFFGSTARTLAEIQSFGKMPLIVIGATEPEPGFGEAAGPFRQFWNEGSRLLAGKAQSGKFILAEGSSHHIHLDAPHIVMDAILELMP